ncbi:MAG: hypothetical protein WCL14_10275 [Bacteroidota bacterium]
MFLLISFTILFSNGIKAQNDFITQKELLKKAEKLFDVRDYVKATPLFSQLLSNYPKDPNYNFKYGVCILYTNKDRSKCLKYLLTSAKNPKTTNDVYYYLGKAYHQNQRYDEAISSFETYKKKASNSDIQKKRIDIEIQSCSNAKNHIGGNVNQVIVSKNEIPYNGFISAYDVTPMEGKIIEKPPIYLMKADKKDINYTSIYLNGKLRVMYFSSYGDDGKNGKDIYKVTKNKKGEWSPPINLGSPINTESDEDYPFISQDGKTLYFCSKGHNSIGGYDVFKSVFDSMKNIWSQPINMGRPVNSANDDLFFIADSLGNANFSSTRECQPGNINFYKVISSEQPVQSVSIKGVFAFEKAIDQKNVAISVLNYNDGSVVQIVTVDTLTGKYDLYLKPGKGYTIIVEKPGFIAHAENIFVPEQMVQHDLAQQLSFSKIDSIERLTISNYFSILEDNNDLNTAVKTEEITSDFKHDENSEKKLRPVNINDKIVKATPPVNDISMQAKVMIASTLKPNDKGTSDSLINQSATLNDTLSIAAVNPQKEEDKSIKETKNSIENNSTKVTAKTTNLELIDMAYNDAHSQENDAKEMHKNAEVAESIAKQKDSVVVDLNKKLTLLNAKITKEKNQIKTNQLRDSVQVIKGEIEEKKQEADVAHALSKEYNDDAVKIQSDADKSYATAKELESTAGMAVKGIPNKHDVINNKSNSNIVSASDSLKSNDLVYKTVNSFKEQSREKQKAADGSLIASYELKNTSIQLSKQADENITKAAITPEPEKTRLKKVAAELERQSAQKQIEADQANRVAKKLNDSAQIIQRKVDIAKNLANEIISTRKDTNNKVIAYKPDQKKEKSTSEINQKTTNATDENRKILSDSVHIDNKVAIVKERTNEKNDSTVAIRNNDTKKSKKDTLLTNKTSKLKDTSTAVVLVEINTKNIDTVKTKSSLSNKDSIVLVNNTTENKVDKIDNVSNSSSSIPSEDLVIAKAKVNRLRDQSNKYISDSQQLYAKAKTTKNQKEKVKLMTQAQNLSDSAVERQKQADVAQSNVEHLETQITTDKIVVANMEAIHEDTLTKEAKKVTVKEKTATEISKKETPKKDSVVILDKVKSAIAKNDSSRKDVIGIKKNKETVIAKKDVPKKDTVIIKEKTAAAIERKDLHAVDKSKQNTQLIAESKDLQSQSDSLAAKSKEVYAKAKITDDKIEKRNLNVQAFSLQNQSDELHNQSVARLNEANGTSAENKTKEIVKKDTVIDNKISTNDTSVAIVKKKDDLIAKPTKEKDTMAVTMHKKEPEPANSDTLLDTSHPDYPKYVQLSSKVKEKKKETEAVFAKAVQLESESKEESAKAKEDLSKADKIKKKSLKKTAIKEATDLKNDAILKQHQADSLYAVSKDMAQQSDEQTVLANALKERIKASKRTQEEPEANAKTAAINKEQQKIESNQASNPPIVFNGNRNVRNNSNLKPIAIADKLPDGLVFKVQIGAFKTPVNASAFVGLSPVTYEQGPNNWLRYTAGLFQTFESANLAKKEIRKMGYRDAFVVAYYNGKRISAYEAGKLVNSYTVPQKQTYQFTFKSEINTLKANNIYPEKYGPENDDGNLNAFNNGVKTSPAFAVPSTTTIAKETPIIAAKPEKPAEDLNKKDGLFYTVQVGVYGTATPPRILEPLKPLNTEVTPKGYYRFLSGLYNYFIPANDAKNHIAKTIVPDAFVVAYYKGARIDMNMARNLEKTVVPMKLSPEIKPKEAPVEPINPPKTDTVKQEIVPSPEIVKPVEKTATINSENVVFKVQIGAYREQVPFDMVDIFLKMSNKGVTHTKDADGLTYFFVGNVKDYNAATQLRNDAVTNGIKDAFVVAFDGEKKITIEEARKSLK